ncbi:hypothetical protein AOZ06_03870 [Kibdelosporangium phytohabitans]|uniref:DUF218 domain-containing protein n=1 Tax=Kibdelosporangium phytohabitans TaxID=860235 RepID=A0A0N7F5L1_9PSEU|nr:YdcF family protein [Kibdelosporangium phytohabitans]ALG14535.1 hypothetical protein AOZ06_03870 [Kibdelosporangium phytohabitans]
MIALVPAAFFIRGFRRDRRRVSNAMWLGITLVVSATLSTSPLAGYAFALVMLGLGVLLPIGLIFNGLEMLRRESRTLGNLLSFITGLAIVALDISFVVSVGTGSSVLISALGLGVITAGYVGFFCASILLYSALYSITLRGKNFSALIVLGARVIGDRVPKLLANRLDRGARIYLAQQAKPTLVVSGGQGDDEESSEAAAMRKYLIHIGIPDTAVLTEDKSTTTEENLRFSAELLARQNTGGSVAAVTNNYHAFRAAVIARRLGLPFEAIGAPTASYYLPSAFLRECIALLRENKIAHAVICGSIICLYLLMLYMA